MEDILKFKIKGSDKIYTIKDGVIVCELPTKLRFSLINLEFKENDDVSEIFKKVAKQYIDYGVFELVENDEEY